MPLNRFRSGRQTASAASADTFLQAAADWCDAGATGAR